MRREWTVWENPKPEFVSWKEYKLSKDGKFELQNKMELSTQATQSLMDRLKQSIEGVKLTMDYHPTQPYSKPLPYSATNNKPYAKPYIPH
jgi:hypothetical protein